jgi:hypothetical protein
LNSRRIESELRRRRRVVWPERKENARRQKEDKLRYVIRVNTKTSS